MMGMINQLSTVSLLSPPLCSTLAPDQMLARQTLVFGKIKYYELSDLKENTQYEIRVSYPAYVR